MRITVAIQCNTYLTLNFPGPMKHTMKANGKIICDVIQPIQKSSFLCTALSQQQIQKNAEQPRKPQY
jgi:hypothetical protein